MSLIILYILIVILSALFIYTNKLIQEMVEESTENYKRLIYIQDYMTKKYICKHLGVSYTEGEQDLQSSQDSDGDNSENPDENTDKKESKKYSIEIPINKVIFIKGRIARIAPLIYTFIIIVFMKEAFATEVNLNIDIQPNFIDMFAAMFANFNPNIVEILYLIWSILIIILVIPGIRLDYKEDLATISVLAIPVAIILEVILKFDKVLGSSIIASYIVYKITYLIYYVVILIYSSLKKKDIKNYRRNIPEYIRRREGSDEDYVNIEDDNSNYVDMSVIGANIEGLSDDTHTNENNIEDAKDRNVEDLID